MTPNTPAEGLKPCPFCSAPGGAYPTKTFAPEDSDPETWVHLEWAAGCSGASIPGNPTCGARIYWGFRSREEAVAAWNHRYHPVDATAMVAPRLWGADSIKDAPEGLRYAVGFDGIYLATVTKEATIAALSMLGSFAYGPLPLPVEAVRPRSEGEG